MPIYYKPVKISKPGIKSGGEYKYYPRVSSRNKIDLDGISTRIAKKCTLHKADIHATLQALTDELSDLMLDNYTVKLGDIGTFSLHIQAEASDKVEEVNNKKIKSCRISFRAGIGIKSRLNSAKFKRIKD